MTKSHRLKTRKTRAVTKNLPLNFLLGCGQKALEDFELARLAEVSDLRKQLYEIMGRYMDAMNQAAFAAWFRSQDRETLKHAIENEESPIEFAKRTIRERSQTEEELLPLPSLPPGAAHLAAAIRYQQRNTAEGKCSECPQPLDRNSVRFCAEHLRKSRDRQRSKKGPRSEPGSTEYLYSGDVTPSTHGRRPGTRQSLTVSREQQTRRILSEMDVPPESAATVLHATESAILKFLPTAEAVAIKENDLFAMIGNPPSRGTARNALMGLLKAEKIRRIGRGVEGDSFRYFKVQ